jgi:hypothetical protein
LYTDSKNVLKNPRREVLSLISEGQISRGMKRVTSLGVASSRDPDVQEQLQAKHPPRIQPMPASVVRGQAVANLRGLRDALVKLERGVSPGCGGCRAEYLTLLGERMEEGDMRVLEEWGLAYIQGELPPWFYCVALSMQTVALYKKVEQEAVHPLGLRHTLIKTLHREVVRDSRPAIREFLEPQQLVLSPAGAAKLVFTVRLLLEVRRDFVCVPLDIKNAYNYAARASIVQVYESEASICHLTQFMATTLAPVCSLEAGGIVFGQAGEGATQGSPDGTDAFCVCLQPSLVRLDQECREGGGIAIGGADDCYAIGPAAVVFPAVLRFKLELKERCNLELELPKCLVFTWYGDLPAGTPEGLELAGEEVNGRFLRGFNCFGCPVGEDEYVTHKIRVRAQKIVEDAKKTVGLLSGDKQALWVSLKWSMTQRFDYWCQLVRPSLVRPIAAYLDAQLWLVLEAALGFRVPRVGQLLDQDCILPVPVLGMEERPFAEWVVRQPVKMYGMGLRSLEDTCYPAYLRALEQAAPYMAQVPGLEVVIGGEASWGDDASAVGRCWSPGRKMGRSCGLPGLTYSRRRRRQQSIWGRRWKASLQRQWRVWGGRAPLGPSEGM